MAASPSQQDFLSDADRHCQLRGGVRRRQPRDQRIGPPRQPDRADRTCRAGRIGFVRARRAPSQGVPRLRPHRHPGSRGGANESHTSHQCRDRPQLGRPGAGFQNFATLDLLSQGRAEIVAGRGSFTESFPLFGLRLEDYDSLFAENLDLLLKIRESEHVHWSGEHRAPLTGQGVYPRPLQDPLPIWLGVGGTPKSFARAGALGLPLMVAIIGGEVRRFRPLVDLYREAGSQAGYSPDRLRVGVHSPGYVAATSQEARDDFFPGWARAVASVAKERGWPAVTRADFDAQLTPEAALLVGSAGDVTEKILRHSDTLGGISRITFQMNASSLPHAKLMQSIELVGAAVAPNLR